MAVIVHANNANNANELSNSIKRDIIQKTIKTWIIDEDDDLTINRTEWREKAWFRIYSSNDTLIFGIISSRIHPMTKELYAVFHGRLSATLLAMYDDIIDRIELTSNVDERYDHCS